jgi:glycerate 2-kinase
MVAPVATSPPVVVAPDSFKGSVSAAQAATAIARGVRSVLPEVPVVEHPIADGGEGTVDAVVRAGLHRVETTVTGPLGDRTGASYAIGDEGAVVELASAAGLGCLPAAGPTRHTARTATTRGVGELIRHALDSGLQQVTVAIGGSATTDGGAGLLTGLGARVTSSGQTEVAPGGAALLDAASLELAGLDPRLRETEVVVACDVDNPLLGPHGAAAVYGPQKGASPEDVELLERALRRWADVVAASTGRDLRDLPGAGAAGGVGFALAAVLGADLRPGAPILLEATGFRRHLVPGALVVVGEGSFDEQSLRGKGPVATARIAGDLGARAVAVAGRAAVTPAQAAAAGIEAVWALTDLEPDPARCMAEAPRLLEEAGRRLALWWRAAGPS